MFLEPLRQAVSEQKTRRDVDSRLVPEFATGGFVPGRFNEARHILAHAGEMIVNRQQQTPALLAAASDAGVPGVKGASSNSQQPVVNVDFYLGTEAQNQLVVNGINSNSGYKTLVQRTKHALKYGDIS